MITEEEKNKRKGMVIAAGSHALLFILFLFLLAWKAPDPPLPEYGIEVNFGLDNVGTGDIQPDAPANENISEEEAAPEELPEEVIEEVVEESEPVEEISPPVQEQVVETPITAQESPDVVPEKKKEPKKPVVKPEEKKEKVVEKTQQVEKKETIKPADGANGKDGDSKDAQAANNGDNADEVGDKGDEQGTYDSRAIYGRAGGGDGSALEMTGWNWDFKPNPKDNSSENGKITFQIKIDDQGEILEIKQLESNVSPSVAKVYREEVQKLTFSRTDFNSVVPPTSTGKITFVIRSK